MTWRPWRRRNGGEVASARQELDRAQQQASQARRDTAATPGVANRAAEQLSNEELSVRVARALGRRRTA
jgi:hypothetical protein